MVGDTTGPNTTPDGFGCTVRAGIVRSAGGSAKSRTKLAVVAERVSMPPPMETDGTPERTSEIHGTATTWPRGNKRELRQPRSQGK